VSVDLDRHAVPRIEAASLADAFRAQGYMHAQERYFQMDLLRRSSAGELAALVGARALPLDRAQRPFRFRTRAAAARARLPARHRDALAAYVEGVNAGLRDLAARPPEYWLLGAAPAPWTLEDSLLVVYALYTMLSNNEAYERGQAVMHETLPPELYAFLTPSTSRFDRPLLTGGNGDATGGYVPAPVPPPDAVDLRKAAPVPDEQLRVDPPLIGPASNQWAVTGAASAHGAAILANDPHLQLRLPNVFYRTELHWPGGAARGVGIPGLPGILLGATAQLAWGATVSNADQSDWVVVEPDPDDDGRYLTPAGSAPFATAVETIEVRGAAAERLELRATEWGPIVATDWRGRPLALQATWLAEDGMTLDVLDLLEAGDLDAGLDVFARWAGPSMNWMLAAASGAVGWVVNGPLPRRVGFDGSRPESRSDGTRRWDGTLAPPRVRSNGGAPLFTANNRTLPAEDAQRLGRMWMRPLRARRIAELLAGGGPFAERDFLQMQLDTRAAAYDELRDIVLEVVAEDDSDPLLRRARAHVAAWRGTAAAESPGFRLLHLYYRALLERALAPLLAPASAADPGFVYRWPLADEPLRRLLEERPPHLLSPGHRDWPAFLRAVLADALRRIEPGNGEIVGVAAAAAAAPDDQRASARGVDAPWGEVNALAAGHPLAGLPLLGRWLRLPAVPQSGSTASLRVAAPDYGALIRMAVAPARPEDGILQMSGGQSGHFLSRNFRDLQDDWVEGTATPFVAGPTVSRIVLEPAR
jgi:penicillin amidase